MCISCKVLLLRQTENNARCKENFTRNANILEEI